MAANKKIVALDVGSQRVTMGVFSAGGKGSLTLRRYESAELLADPSADATRTAQVRAAVEELAAKLKVKGELTRYAVSGRSAFMRFVKLPPLDIDQVDQIVEFEAQQNVPFPIDEVVWDYQLIGEDQTEVEAVIIAVKSETLDELNEAIEASVRAEAVDAAPMAVYNAVRFNYPEITEPLLLIDIGARSTNLIYVDGNRVFARNSTAVGGATISQAIAKDFDADFTTAEHRKIEDGLVNLGGAYEDPDDPEVAAISKVIRNTLTRLHADIVRTTNQYRGQQGGAAPQRVLLAGGSVGLGYVKEFFEEKLKLPVEFFNPLKNVGVGGQVDTDLAGREAYRLGELVGLALRSAGVDCPMEIDLVPDAVARARDVKSRRPFLMTAAAVVFAVLGAGIVHFNSAQSIASQKTDALQAQQDELDEWNGKIRDEQALLADDQLRAAELGATVDSRTGWLELLNELNQKLPSDRVWVTVLEPLAGSKVIEGKTGNHRDADGAVRDALVLFDSGEDAEESGGRRGAKEPLKAIDKIHIKGLYRAEGGGAEDVSKFLDRLAESPYFMIENLDLDRPKYMPLIMRAGAGNRWAYPFEFVLPLREPMN